MKITKEELIKRGFRNDMSANHFSFHPNDDSMIYHDANLGSTGVCSIWGEESVDLLNCKTLAQLDQLIEMFKTEN